MSKFPGYCDICHEFGLSDRHRCPPLFKVHLTDWHGEDEPGDSIMAIDAEEAAAKWADSFDGDCNDYGIVGGKDVIVTVTDEAGWQQRVSVSGESRAVYTGTIIKETDDEKSAI